MAKEREGEGAQEGAGRGRDGARGHGKGGRWRGKAKRCERYGRGTRERETTQEGSERAREGDERGARSEKGMKELTRGSGRAAWVAKEREGAIVWLVKRAAARCQKEINNDRAGPYSGVGKWKVREGVRRG